MNSKLYDRICSATDKFVPEIQFHATHKDALEGMGFTVGDNIHDYPSIPENYNHYCVVDYKFHDSTRQVAGWGNSDREALGMCIRESSPGICQGPPRASSSAVGLRMAPTQGAVRRSLPERVCAVEGIVQGPKGKDAPVGI